MTDARQSKGPWMHRFLIWFFSIALGALIWWLLGFIVDDIGTLPGPSRAEVEGRMIDQGIVKQRDQLAEQIAAVDRKIKTQEGRQKILRDSKRIAQETMNQMLELQKLSLQKDVKPSPEQQQALAESEKLFLAEQTRDAAINEEIAGLNEQMIALEDQRRDIEANLAAQRKTTNEEFERLLGRHNIKVGFLKLAVLIPLLLGAGYLFRKKSASVYVPIIYAFGLALVIRVGMVMREYFPRRFFKYVLILAAILVVLRILVYLLRMIVSPSKDWLLKQYREAYERFFCPICGYPIRRGPLRYAFWTRRTIRKQAMPDAAGAAPPEEPYTCPACGSKVFEKCEACQAIRHSHLPFCDKCGAEK